MANSFYWVDSAANERTLYIAGTSTTQFVLQGSEYGTGRVGKPYHEATPNRMSDNYRAWIYDRREYGFDVLIKADTASDLETAIGTWDGWHDPELDEGYIKRITVGGTTRCLDCIALPVEWKYDGPTSVTGKQAYIASNPWWRSETRSVTSGIFNGSTDVNVECANGGHIPAWFTAIISGIVETPKLTNSEGDYIEVNYTTTNADDVIVIITKPWGPCRRYAYYREHGTGDLTPVQMTSGSEWITLPTGTGNLVLSAASGTPTFDIAWYLYYRSLY